MVVAYRLAPRVGLSFSMSMMKGKKKKDKNTSNDRVITTVIKGKILHVPSFEFFWKNVLVFFFS